MLKNFFCWLFALLLFNSCQYTMESLNYSENKYPLTTEKTLQNADTITLINSFYDRAISGTFLGVDSIPIFYKLFPQALNAKGQLFISSGRTEACVKYKALIYDLYANGYSVFILDHRGQGLSGRMTNDHELGYIDSFENYVLDYKYFYDSIVEKKPNEKRFLLAHSMGGAIGMYYLLRYPTDFVGAAFSSPMFGLGFMQCTVAKFFDNAEIQYAATQKPYLESKETFERNTVTNCKIRFDITNLEYENDAKIRLGGVSYRWINECCKGIDFIFDHLENLETPCVIFSADEEQIVDPKAHHHFVSQTQALNKRVEGFVLKNAKHELFMEKDSTRNRLLNKVFDFYSLY